MKLTTSIHRDVAVLTLSGDLNSDSLPKFREAVAALLADQRRDCVVDLNGVTGVDSVGLEALTALQRQCEEQLGMVRLCGLDAMVRKVFEMTRLDKQFTVHEDVEEALASFA